MKDLDFNFRFNGLNIIQNARLFSVDEIHGWT